MKICYFGIYNPKFSRNKIYMEGLRRNGVEVVECNDRSRGFLKFWRLWQKYRTIGSHDVMIVGYPSQIAVPLAKLISRKKIILDALCSLYEGEVLSRGRSPRSLFALKTWCIDFLAYQLADRIFVESNAQVDFFVKTFFVNRGKLVRVFTGALDSVFFPDSSVHKREVFTVVFRGQFLPEAGVDTILECISILQKTHAGEHIDFLFIGKDFGKIKLAEKVSAMGLRRVEIINRFLAPFELRTLMLSCHVSLGQFGAHVRLDRTIPHKAFETLAMGLPYVTGRAGGISELLIHTETCLMVSLADSQGLARAILELKTNVALAKELSQNGLNLYASRLTPSVLAKEMLKFF